MYGVRITITFSVLFFCQRKFPLELSLGGSKCQREQLNSMRRRNFLREAGNTVAKETRITKSLLHCSIMSPPKILTYSYDLAYANLFSAHACVSCENVFSILLEVWNVFQTVTGRLKPNFIMNSQTSLMTRDKLSFIGYVTGTGILFGIYITLSVPICLTFGFLYVISRVSCGVGTTALRFYATLPLHVLQTIDVIPDRHAWIHNTGRSCTTCLTGRAEEQRTQFVASDTPPNSHFSLVVDSPRHPRILTGDVVPPLISFFENERMAERLSFEREVLRDSAGRKGVIAAAPSDISPVRNKVVLPMTSKSAGGDFFVPIELNS